VQKPYRRIWQLWNVQDRMKQIQFIIDCVFGG
jgi:hypothetical protein